MQVTQYRPTDMQVTQYRPTDMQVTHNRRTYTHHENILI